MVQLIAERDIEQALKRRIEKEIPGAMALKFTSPGLAGVPDRVLLLPHGLVVWVEVKRPGECLRPLQEAVHERMRRVGHKVLTVDSMSAVDVLIGWIGDSIRAAEKHEPIPSAPESLIGRCSR